MSDWLGKTEYDVKLSKFGFINVCSLYYKISDTHSLLNNKNILKKKNVLKY